MNLKNKQVVALALALLVGSGVFFSAPRSVFASDLSFSLSYMGDANGTIINLDFFYLNPSDVFMIGVPYKINNQISCTYMFVSLSPFQANSIGHMLSYAYSGGTNFSRNMDYSGSFDRFYYNYFSFNIIDPQCDFLYETFYDAVPYHITCLQDMNVVSGIDTYAEYEEYFSGEVADAIYSLLNGHPNDNVESNSSFIYENAVDELGYIVNVHASNAVETETNGGKDWINRIKYSRRTSTDFDLKSDGADVQYFFVFNGVAKTKLGLGSKIDMSEYTSDARYAGNEHTYFSYTSDDWRSVYQDWMNANNLSSTDRVVDTDVEVWMRPILKENIFSPIKVGGWTVLTEDGGTYLIDSDETCNYNDDNSELKPGRDSNSSNGDSAKTDNTQKIGVDLDDSDAVDDALDNGNHVNTTDQIKDQFNDFDLGDLPTILDELGEAAQSFAEVLKVVFSWLPSWVVGSIIAAVFIWIFMLIKRAIF